MKALIGRILPSRKKKLLEMKLRTSVYKCDLNTNAERTRVVI